MTVFTRTSDLTGKLNSMDLPIIQEAVAAWKQSGQYVQDFFPQLNADQREFLLTGATPEEWEELFGSEEE